MKARKAGTVGILATLPCGPFESAAIASRSDLQIIMSPIIALLLGLALSLNGVAVETSPPLTAPTPTQVGGGHDHAEVAAEDVHAVGTDVHDHAVDHGQATARSSIGRHLIRFLGAFHPAIIHFPIALMLAAAVAEALAWRTRRQHYPTIARFCLIGGTATSILAVGLGWADWLHVYVTDEEAWALLWHQWVGSIVAISALTTLSVAWRTDAGGAPVRLMAYRYLLGLTALLVAAAGYLGGEIVYGTGHLAW